MRKAFGIFPTTATAPFCPSEVQGSVRFDARSPLWRQMFRFAGPGLLVAVGYMDPGNWATDIEAGSRLGLDLLFVVVLSGLAAALFQLLAVRLGLGSGRDLAQACRDRYPRPVALTLWALAELAIIATDLAEVLGAALAFKLLFGLPLAWGVVLTTLDLLLVLGLQGAGIRRVEAIIMGLVATIGLCFAAELALAHPDGAAVARGLIPDPHRLAQPHALYLAIGIVGATIMPHNLYLHSSLVQTRKVAPGARSGALRWASLDAVAALLVATLVNGAILALAATAFHAHGHMGVAGIEDAQRLLQPVTGAALAPLIFGLALFASGQSSTFTGTIAGQVILEGFLSIKIPCWRRRALTRLLAVAPALAGVLLWGEGAVGRMLVLSQVVLAAQLPFALYPLIRLSGDRRLMGKHATPPAVSALAWLLFAVLAAADLLLLAQAAAGA